MALERTTLGRSAFRRDGGTGSSSGSFVPPLLAEWTITSARYFFVSYDTGNDGNLGYIDAAPGTVFGAGVGDAIAIKTFTRLFQILPLQGNNRTLVLLIKNRAAGATYLDVDGVTQSVCDFSALSGYRIMLRRGSTDFTNSVADRFQAGFVTALAGPNGDGSFTCLGGATTTVWSVTGTPFTAEPGILHYRVRFSGNVTAGLANVCTPIQLNTSSQITAAFAVTAPAVGDTFFIEKPGVSVAQWIDTAGSDARSTSINVTFDRAGIRDVGIMVKAATAASLNFSGAPREISGCEQDSTAAANVFRMSDQSFAVITAGYSDETDTTRAVGMGLRMSATGFAITRVGTLNADAFGHARNGGAASMDRIHYGNIFTGAYLGSALTCRAMGHPAPGSGLGLIMGAGSVAGANKTRIVGGLVLSSVALALRGIDFATASSAISFAATGENGGTVMFDNLTGTSGISATGINCANAKASTFLFGTVAANTIAGAVNEILSDLAQLTHAGLTRTNVIDLQRNEYIGTAGRIVSACARVTAIGALAVGDVVRGTGTSGQATAAQADTLANSPVIGVMVTAPASTAVGYMAPPGAGTPSITFTAAPTAGAIAYLSPTTAKQGTTTEPVLTGTQQKVKLGRTVRVSGSNAECAFEPDIKPENTFEVQPLGVAVSNAAASFSATQSWLIATGTYSADRAFTLEAASTLSVNTRRIVSDFTTGGAFNILLTPNAADSIDGQPVGTPLAIACGSKFTVEVRLMPSGGWKVM